MNRKKCPFCLALLFFVLLIVPSVSANAQTDWSAALKVEQVFGSLEEETISIRVSVEQITSESGILCASFEIHYDNSCLELISWENSHPTSWDFSETKTYGAEDWTMKKEGENGTYFMYTLLNSAMSDGVKKDGELSTELQFRVLKNGISSTEICIKEITFTDEELTDSCILSDQKFVLSLESNNIESVSAESAIIGETYETQISMLITVEDIADTAGVSCLQFTLSYDPSVLQFIRYECLLPEDWDLNTEYTEDLTNLRTEEGILVFCVMNNEQGHGVKQNGVLGFRVEFTIQGASFDPSMITLKDALLINDRLEDIAGGNYRLSVRYDLDRTSLSGDIFSSNDSEGKPVKILIVVIAAVVILGSAVCTFIVIRKKKLV